MTNKGKEIDKMDLIKTEIFSVANIPAWEKISVKHIYLIKNLLSRIYKKNYYNSVRQ